MASPRAAGSRARSLRFITAASSVGTLIEWYDFYVFGSLATVIAPHFFPSSNPTAALLSTLATFAVGFIVRPFGALVFGRLGDLAGRKFTFLLTLVLMGSSTFAIGLVPGYDRIGIAAPLIVLLLRLAQGLALGGEYGGASIYIAEHAPPNRRGFFTSLLQSTSSFGMLISLGVILITRYALDANHTASVEKFNDWGWRITFLLSIVLVAISVYIRLQMEESPLFTKLKNAGKLSANPLKESFANKANLKIVLLALFGVTMGQGVVFYTGQFYIQTFMERVCRIDFDQAKKMLLIAIALGTPFFVVAGSWSDRIGRKWIMLAGMLLAVATWTFFFREIRTISDPAGRQLLPGRTEIRNSVAFIGGTTSLLRTSATLTWYDDGMQVTEEKKDTVYRDGHTSRLPVMTTSRSLPAAGYWKIVAILFAMTVFVAMVCGPVPAFLVELFPTRIRYSSMSLPYHLGNGVIGGLTPFIAVLMTSLFPGHDLVGLWYPVGVTLLCLLIGAIGLPAPARAKHLVPLEDIES
jgi:MFS family permease